MKRTGLKAVADLYATNLINGITVKFGLIPVCFYNALL